MTITTSTNEVLFNSTLYEMPDYWPFKVINATFGDKNMYLQANVPGIYEAINTLSDREKEIILLRFKDEMTLKDIGNRFGISQERSRQIIAKALRKLRHPSRFKFMLATSRADYDEIKERLKFAEATIAKLQADEPTKNVLELSIEDVAFSYRAFHCLHQANINNIADLSTMTVKDLLKIHNLGTTTAREIVYKLKSFGINIPEE